MSQVVKVRIPIAVDPQGRWYAYGWRSSMGQGPNDHDELLELTDTNTIGPNEALFWITAELPIPEKKEVAGEIEALK